MNTKLAKLSPAKHSHYTVYIYIYIYIYVCMYAYKITLWEGILYFYIRMKGMFYSYMMNNYCCMEELLHCVVTCLLVTFL